MNKFTNNLTGYILSLDSKKLVFICIALILISYINSLGAYFIWDDYSLIVTDPAVRNWNINNLLSPAHKDDSSNLFKTPLYFRALQILSYALDFKIWRLNPFGYHLTNLILHILSALLLFLLLLFLFKDRTVAFLGAALFAINPIFTSSVTYISGRADILTLLFINAMLLFFIKGIKENRLNLLYHTASLLCFICVLLSKEAGLIGLIFLFMIDKLIYKYSTSVKKSLIYLPFIAILFISSI
jgi:dolichyl-phosphate-mannose--protein O-mannosyl transferase